ncbi:MMPL/RND family transporter [Mycobacterium sherrisii]|uniref:MMPL/RND family transporter n=1 Tax=Mycobacterium sherrisii TaxID=243061 RepID=UPI000A16165E|nr:RND family transporter [Mycobacterium sherrisii]MCV7031287.1 RND family transporter [Mycobacterium sherrisii]ORW78241.1 hypothetical protein AWC25_06560 [Mycobacterium sherrisii]
MSAHAAIDVSKPPEHLFMAGVIHRFAVPIVLGWVALVIVLSASVPSLESVGQERAVALSPGDAPSYEAMKRIGKVFNEGDSDNSAMIVLEGTKPLGDEAHRYYDRLVAKLRAETRYVRSVPDLWGDPLTASGVQSNDGKAAYVEVNLAGDRGERLAGESIESVRSIVNGMTAPAGVTVWITGASVIATDMHQSGDRSMMKMIVASVVVISLVLLVVYRSMVTVVLLLATVGVETMAARTAVALLGHHTSIGLTTFAVSLLTSLAIAAGTDYGIFLIGRYQEARQSGEDPETAFYTTYRGTAHVIAGSGLTIVGATFCLAFARLPYFNTMGLPCALGMIVAVVVALTLGPAVLAVGSRFGLFDPKRPIEPRGWRRVGTVVVRWPLPILAASCAVALIGLVTLPGYTASYNDRAYLPSTLPANQGFAAADRHFSQARLKPEVLLVEADHDLRNPTDSLVLDRLAKGIFRVPGIARVQGITRPDGTTMDHTSIPFQLSMQNASQLQTMQYQRDRMNDLLQEADDLQQSIDAMQRVYGITAQIATATHDMNGVTHEMVDVTDQLRDNIATFEDFWRPIRSYFYWEKHCFDIPLCASLGSVFNALDGVDQITEKLTALSGDVSDLDRLMPQLLAQIPTMISTMVNMRTTILTMHSTMSGIFAQMDEMSQDAMAMGHAFDASKNDDSFYLPPEVFSNKNFQRAMSTFLSPDGHAARFIILHRSDPATSAEIASIDAIRMAAQESLKGTPLEDAKIYLAGTAAVFKDIAEGANYDLIIAGVCALCLIFVIMLILTRAFVAAGVIVGTVAFSLGASFGLSVLVWQHLLGLQLHWSVLAMSVIVLLAVGSDYNLLLVSRFRQEIHAGLNTGIIRSMGGTGRVVTNAGLVFAFTMASMVVSDLRVIGQLGTTIGLGLLFDTLVVRAFITPAIAALLGRWFWWPMRVRSRPRPVPAAQATTNVMGAVPNGADAVTV